VSESPATGAPALFETDRIVARHIVETDVDDLFAVYGDAEAMKWVDDGQPIAWQSCVDWVGVTHRNYAARGYGMTAIVLKETARIVGFCGVVHPGGQIEPELKYAYLREVWGIGLATEVARAMISYAADAFSLRRIIATTDPDNLASHRVLIKAGMSHLETTPNDDGSFTKTFVWESSKS